MNKNKEFIIQSNLKDILLHKVIDNYNYKNEFLILTKEFLISNKVYDKYISYYLDLKNKKLNDKNISLFLDNIKEVNKNEKKLLLETFKTRFIEYSNNNNMFLSLLFILNKFSSKEDLLTHLKSNNILFDEPITFGTNYNKFITQINFLKYNSSKTLIEQKNDLILSNILISKEEKYKLNEQFIFKIIYRILNEIDDEYLINFNRNEFRDNFPDIEREKVKKYQYQFISNIKKNNLKFYQTICKKTTKSINNEDDCNVFLRIFLFGEDFMRDALFERYKINKLEIKKIDEFRAYANSFEDDMNALYNEDEKLVRKEYEIWNDKDKVNEKSEKNDIILKYKISTYNESYKNLFVELINEKKNKNEFEKIYAIFQDRIEKLININYNKNNKIYFYSMIKETMLEIGNEYYNYKIYEAKKLELISKYMFKDDEVKNESLFVENFCKVCAMYYELNNCKNTNLLIYKNKDWSKLKTKFN